MIYYLDEYLDILLLEIVFNVIFHELMKYHDTGQWSVTRAHLRKSV